jgi:hypothetical protein
VARDMICAEMGYICKTRTLMLFLVIIGVMIANRPNYHCYPLFLEMMVVLLKKYILLS